MTVRPRAMRSYQSASTGSTITVLPCSSAISTGPGESPVTCIAT